MDFKIEHAHVYGLPKSFIASGNAMRTIMEDNEKDVTAKDIKRVLNLAKTPIGEGHDNFLNGNSFLASSGTLI